MSKTLTAIVSAIALTSTAALAQTTAPKSTTPTTPAATMDAKAAAKFDAADKDHNGVLSGAELDAYRADLSKIDTNKDGSISRDEFAAAAKSGVIK